jgi:pyruvate ferredoxin oxidoreductase gamma subunit
VLEMRWHGRGGQGSKTASILMARIAATAGKYIQAFPEYGPERMGAPVLAYTRIDDQPIHLHCQIENPNLVVVLDPTLIGTVDLTANLVNEGKLIINSDREPEELRQEMGIADNIGLFVLDANTISREEIGRIFPNMPMLGAINRVINWMEQGEFVMRAKEELSRKFSHKPEVIKGNVKAIERAYLEVKGQ